MANVAIPLMLDSRLVFPDPRSNALANAPRGLIAFGGDLSPERLILAYRSGIFPWTDNPITWWSPETRGIFELDRFHVSRSLARVIRQQRFEVSVDRAFREVMRGCATENRERSWITPRFMEAYCALHKAGHAHSVECWCDGELAGGIYGVRVGGLFAGESMFHRVSDASKTALYYLVQILREHGFALFDIQMLTPITERLGAVTISREDYLARLTQAVPLQCVFPPKGPLPTTGLIEKRLSDNGLEGGC